MTVTVPRTGYAAGFLIDDADHVLLIRKNRPAWQAGKLNGIGGKIEPGECAVEAMRREFREEAGLDIAVWDELLTLDFPAGTVVFFRAFTDTGTLDAARSVTDEVIEKWCISDLLTPNAPTIPNLRWLLPLAAYRHDRYRPLTVIEDHPSAAY